MLYLISFSTTILIAFSSDLESLNYFKSTLNYKIILIFLLRERFSIIDLFNFWKNKYMLNLESAKWAWRNLNNCHALNNIIAILLSSFGFFCRFLVPGWRMGWIIIHDRQNVLEAEVGKRPWHNTWQHENNCFSGGIVSVTRPGMSRRIRQCALRIGLNFVD